MSFFINDSQAEELGAALDPSTVTSTTVTPPAGEIAAKQPSLEQSLMSFLPLIVIFAIFYFFIIRPQVKKQKEHQKMVEAVKKGDKVVLSSGMIGTLIKTEENNEFAQVEIAENVKVRVLKSAISQLLNEDKAVTPIKESKKDSK
ncbi:preprotein translocase subunit YajC [Rickettsiales endosymbiont of Stachyamoeba lipophora]|uniref:preprotein translocase subunit YajC n=1 Tax=Rickettsiales endosymbiont of Stachyamoeba lipophora TaxID=2486578 RepID=UPI0019D2EAAA|nr:preprotein translocase subunit YajC [Rickettsiales endosymbiont of Stachyamoeba lipophora]